MEGGKPMLEFSHSTDGAGNSLRGALGERRPASDDGFFCIIKQN